SNGLLRQYFPKGTDLSRWNAGDLEAIALTLNNRPRKVLGFRTPAEVFNEQLQSTQNSSVATTDWTHTVYLCGVSTGPATSRNARLNGPHRQLLRQQFG